MKFKILIFTIILSNCSANYTKFENRQPYNSTGFAYIFNDKDYESKMVKTNFNNDQLEISHQKLKTGTLIKIINPKTQENIVLKNSRRTKYPDFYNILITTAVADKLNIDPKLPLVELLEIKKNKSFVAQKAKVFQEEKKILANAPVTSVKIANISKKKINKKQKQKDNIFILIASFYTNEAANLLKKRITKEATYFDSKKLSIKKKSIKEFEVLSGPYSSINPLKNDYINLKNFGFEELDIFINE